jgi:MoxR-like ATPase
MPRAIPQPIEATTDLAAVIAQHVAHLLPSPSADLDEDRVKAIIRETVSQNGALHVTVSVRGSSVPPYDAGRQHEQFPILLSIIARRRNVWLAGPAGSGKTSAAHAAATALGLAFGAISVGPQTTQSALFGYMDAHGNYIATEFRRRYEQGGLFLFDEIDRGNPGVLTALNQAIENGTCAFPDAMIPKHPDFIAVAAGNTYGNGASREYVGALQLDAATLDRFVMLDWHYDETLERDLATATYQAAGGTDARVLEHWLSKVKRARDKAQSLKIRHIVSPRASIIGADLLASGLAPETVADCVLWKGLDADTIERLS